MRSNHNSASNVSLARRNNTDPQNLVSPFGSVTGLFGDLYPVLSASPFQLMERMQQDMDHLFSQVAASPQGNPSQSDMQTTARFFTPTVDVSETEKEYRIEVDLPGVSQDAIDVRVVESTLIIRAEMRQETNSEPGKQTQESSAQGSQNAQRHYHHRERRWGRFERVFHLPSDAEEGTIGADFASGVLTLTIPKRINQVEGQQGRRIAIGTAGNLPEANDAAENVPGNRTETTASLPPS